MAFTYKVKRRSIEDDNEVVATVRGLSLNDIVDLTLTNKDAMTMIFDQFKDREVNGITEAEVLSTATDMIAKLPLVVANIIAVASDAWEDYDTESDISENPIQLIMAMPTGLQARCLEVIGEMTFTKEMPPKKIMGLVLKTLGTTQSNGPTA